MAVFQQSRGVRHPMATDGKIMRNQVSKAAPNVAWILESGRILRCLVVD